MNSEASLASAYEPNRAVSACSCPCQSSGNLKDAQDPAEPDAAAEQLHHQAREMTAHDHLTAGILFIQVRCMGASSHS